MNTPGERDEFAEAIAARAASPDRLKLFRDELWQASLRFARLRANIQLVLIISIPLAILLELTSASGKVQLVPLLVRLSCYTLCVIVLLVLWFIQTSRLRRLRQELPERIRRSGLIERIALGPFELPDIFRYTVWPWGMFHGSRPVEFTGYAKLIAMNIDWYLQPAPQRVFRIMWLYVVLMVAFFPLMFWIIGYGSHAAPTGPLVPDLSLWFFYAMMLAMFALSLMLNRERAYLAYCAEAMYEEVKQRLRGNEAPGSAVE